MDSHIHAIHAFDMAGFQESEFLFSLPSCIRICGNSITKCSLSLLNNQHAYLQI